MGAKSSRTMPRSLIQVYALTVCFCTLMCGVIALGVAGYDMVRIAAPGFTISSGAIWSSDEQFLLYYPDKKGIGPMEIANFRESQRREALSTERKTGQQGFVYALIILAIDAAVYAIHWRIARRVEVVAAASG